MTNKPEPNGKAKLIQQVAGILLAAILTSGAGMMYRHEVSLLEQERDLSKIRMRVYRERMRDYEFHERYTRAIIQMIQLRENKEGLSIVDKSRLSFYESHKELIQEEKSNYVETYKHEGQ